MGYCAQQHSSRRLSEVRLVPGLQCSLFTPCICLHQAAMCMCMRAAAQRKIVASSRQCTDQGTPARPAQVFEKGNFAGLDEMKRSERQFNRVAPMGVADIVMAVQYRHVQRPPLRGTPIVALEGLADATIDPAAMAQWVGYTSGRFRAVPLMGDHYFVSSHFREVRVAGPVQRIVEVTLSPLPGHGGMFLSARSYNLLVWLMDISACPGAVAS